LAFGQRHQILHDAVEGIVLRGVDGGHAFAEQHLGIVGRDDPSDHHGGGAAGLAEAVEQALGQTGFMHYVVAFAKPFRMPDFFLISGLFLAQVIDRDWRTYLDRKVVHFAYFYLLWTALQFAFKAPLFVAEQGVAGTAWAFATVSTCEAVSPAS